MATLDEITSALDAIDPAGLGYSDWLNVGFALHELGAPCSTWDDWSRRDPERYHASGSDSCEAKWRTMTDGGGISGGWLWRVAYNCGWGGWSDPTGHQPTNNTRSIPEPPDMTPCQQAAAQLRVLFDVSENCCIVTAAKFDDKKQKWGPADGGKVYNVGSLLARLDSASSLDAALGAELNPDAGAWVCCNPTNEHGHSNRDVTAYRHALVESDEVDAATQKAIYAELNLPVSCLVDSAGKSVHALVNVDAEGPTHYAERVQALFEACDQRGLKVDKANKNPGRLTRLAGARRGERVQRFIGSDLGAPSFETWRRTWGQATNTVKDGFDPLPPFGSIDVANPPRLAPELIHGVLRRGHMLITFGDSKSGKTWNLLQLGLAVACGSKWLGCECRQGRVLYIDFELDPASFAKRVAWICDRLGYDAETVRRNFVPWNLRGFAAALDQLEPQVVQRASNNGFDLVIFDPLYLVMSDDENGNGDMRDFVRVLARIGRTLGCSIAAAHHHAKGASGDKKAVDRGSGAGTLARYPDAIVDFSELAVNSEFETAHAAEIEKGTTFWRVTMILREFRGQSFNCYFTCPIHVCDQTGELDGLKVTSSMQKGGSRSGEQATQRRNDRDENLATLILPALAERCPDGIPIEVVCDSDGRKPDAVKKAVDRLDGWRREVVGGNSCVVKPM